MIVIATHSPSKNRIIRSTIRTVIVLPHKIIRIRTKIKAKIIPTISKIVTQTIKTIRITTPRPRKYKQPTSLKANCRIMKRKTLNLVKRTRIKENTNRSLMKRREDLRVSKTMRTKTLLPSLNMHYPLMLILRINTLAINRANWRISEAITKEKRDIRKEFTNINHTRMAIRSFKER